MNDQLSLAMIVRDCSSDLARCLDSVKDVVDEIIIVDTGSLDDTVETAKRYTDKVFNFEWIDDFAAARNFSFSHCTKDFIFWLDADDVVNPDQVEKLKAIDLSDKHIIISQYEYSHDEFGNPYSIVPRERIVRRSLGIKWVGEIHEYLPLKAKTYISDFRVCHKRNHNSSGRNLAILERVVKGDSKEEFYVKPEAPARMVYYLGKEYHDVGRHKECIPYLKEFIKMGSFWEDVYNVHFMLAKTYRVLGIPEKFKYHLYESLKIEERRAEPYCLMGLFYFNNKQWKRAAHWYKLAKTIERPDDLLAMYQPEFYTWLPYLQLGVCYNHLNKIDKAIECNNEVLKFRPADQRALKNKNILLARKEPQKDLKDGEGKKLNLGCGRKMMPGFVNVDIFKAPGIDEQFEFDNIPYLDGTIASISSEHALEHVGHDRTRNAVQEWFRVLRSGGELLLKIPDLEECCRKYLEAPIDNPRFQSTKFWYKCTIYGIQKSQGGEPDEAQYHRSGFGQSEIKRVLEDTGFVIDYMETYDGWGTPSIAVRALKPVSNLKVGWIAPNNRIAAQTRIRVLNVDRWLRLQGYESRVATYNEIVKDNFDVAVVGKAFDENHFKNIKFLKQNRKIVMCDLCEDILQFPWVKEILKICDKVICCSYELEKRVKEVNPNTCVIEDAWES